MLRFIFLFFGLTLPAGSLFSATGEIPNWNDLFFKVANFLLFFILLHIAASKPIKTALRSGLKKKADKFNESEIKLNVMKKGYVDLKEKIDLLREDLDSMKNSSMKSAEEEKKKIIKGAEKHAQKLIKQTELQIEQRKLHARESIKAFLLKESVKMASSPEGIKILDQSQLIRQFQSKISSIRL